MWDVTKDTRCKIGMLFIFEPPESIGTLVILMLLLSWHKTNKLDFLNLGSNLFLKDIPFENNVNNYIENTPLKNNWIF